MGQQLVRAMGEYFPAEIVAGVTLEIPVTLTAYPASDWTLTVALRGPHAHPLDLTAVADGDTHVIRATAAETSDYHVDPYYYSMRVTDGTDVIEVDSGQTRILPDLASLTGAYDGRSHVQRVLDAIEAVIEGRATIDQQSYSIGNRTLARTPIGDLLSLRTKYRDELRREQAAAKGQSLLGRRVLTRF